MSILVDRTTKVITQGMTGDTGTFHTEQALAYGPQMVGVDLNADRRDLCQIGTRHHTDRCRRFA